LFSSNWLYWLISLPHVFDNITQRVQGNRAPFVVETVKADDKATLGRKKCLHRIRH
jgi:hypothetical protein